MRIRALAATTVEEKNPFSVADLLALSATSIGAPVTIAFDTTRICGTVTDAIVLERQLYIEAEIEGVDIELRTLYLVPGYESESYKIITYGLISHPADENLNPVKIIRSSC